MTEWIIRNKWVIIAGLLGIALGWLGNYLANKASEKRIIEALTAEIEKLKNQRLTEAEKQRLEELQMKKNLLTSRYGICSSCRDKWQQQNCPNCEIA